MGMFTDLMNKIFHHAPVAERPATTPVSTPPTTSGTTTMTAPTVDVASILTKLASENKEKLDWKHSIVDLMKLVGMDSSFVARRNLAADLNYTGDTNDSASMNIWLHKEVMTRLAANGGHVPAELLAH